jgi:serine/threonine-protein kinase
VVARLAPEARAASAVASDYIVQIFDFGRDATRGLYMIIEYLAGEDLEARLQRERWIGDEETAIIGLHLARGLAKAHAAGIIHRDLKPANVFLTHSDDRALLAKILDFGISRFEAVGLAGAGEPALTQYGMTLGTPQYMSPEQCEGKLALDARTDVWSACAVLYEMIAGDPAISDAGGYIATMLRILKEDVPPLASRAAWVSPALANVIDAGLRRDRRTRLGSALELAAALLAAYPSAGSRPSLATAVANTDVSELGPVSEAAPPAIPPVAHAPLDLAVEASRRKSTDPPPPSKRASSVPPPSSDEGVAIFARGEVPSEVLKLRSKIK